jgi:hypothetical protein
MTRSMPPLTSQLEAANGHRADFESERDRVSRLMPELLRATADTMTAVVAAAVDRFAEIYRPWDL